MTDLSIDQLVEALQDELSAYEDLLDAGLVSVDNFIGLRKVITRDLERLGKLRPKVEELERMLKI
jgi:hypothetical protein